MTSLTREQQRAVASDAHALEIRAGAGTGKTTTLAHRLGRIVADGTPEHRILAVTFTRDAMRALDRKLSGLLGRGHGVRVQSFHQWAARELASEEPEFLDQDDARRIILRALQRRPATARLTHALGASNGDDIAFRLQGFLSYVRNSESTVGDAILRQFPALATWEDDLTALDDAYQEGKRDRLDFDDLLIRFRDRVKRGRSLRAEVAARLDHVAVDEYQDVNRAQAETVWALTAGTGPDVTVVGDPRQSIYGFRGAAPAYLDGFLKPYGKGGESVALTASFRSTASIVDAGNIILPDAHPLRPRPRAPKGDAPLLLAFDTPVEEARGVADRNAALLAAGAEPEDIVVLCRSRNLAAAYHAVVNERGGDLRSIHVGTIHAAKGLEWDHVTILGAREGGLPSEHALRAEGAARDPLLAEERRLLYVAATRARKTLAITWPSGARGRGPSRFLSTMLGAVVEEKPRTKKRAAARKKSVRGAKAAKAPASPVPTSGVVNAQGRS